VTLTSSSTLNGVLGLMGVWWGNSSLSAITCIAVSDLLSGLVMPSTYFVSFCLSDFRKSFIVCMIFMPVVCFEFHCLKTKCRYCKYKVMFSRRCPLLHFTKALPYTAVNETLRPQQNNPIVGTARRLSHHPKGRRLFSLIFHAFHAQLKKRPLLVSTGR
jgi:hypothetical protein